MTFIEQDIKGVWVIEPKRFGDKRGYFSEVFKAAEFDAHVGHVDFVQDNESLSARNVVRGLHFQRPPFTQSKLLRCVRGAVLDVVVDIRKGSPTYGQHVAPRPWPKAIHLLPQWAGYCLVQCPAIILGFPLVL